MMTDGKTGLTRSQIRALLVIGVALGLLITPVVANYLSNDVDVDDGVVFEAGSGPSVELTGDVRANLTDAFPNSTTVELRTDSGNVTFNGTSGGELVIDEADINGTYTEVTSASVSGERIRIAPDDKGFAEIGGGTTKLNFTDAKVEDNSDDFTYSSSGEGAVNISTNGTDGTAYGAVDPSTNEALDVGTADSNGLIDYPELPDRTNQDIQLKKTGILTIRNETAPHGKVDTVEAKIKFYEDEDDNPTILNKTTNDGTIDLSNLPIDEPFVVSLRADGYHNRTVRLPDLTQQETAYMLDKDNSHLETRFTISDRTGNFPTKSTEIVVQRAINSSLYESGGSFAWRAVGGDDLGADEAYVIDLQEERRYRIKVINDDGDERVLGAYTAETSGTVDLTIGSVALDPTEDDSPTLIANRTNKTGEDVEVNVEYNDSTDSTNTIYLRIHEYGNESNELLANTTYTAGPYGVFTHTEPVPDGENNTEWVVNFNAERDGKDAVQAEIIVSPTEDVLGGMPTWLVTIIYMASIWLVAGLFSQLNGDIGALVVAGMGGIFWFAGFTPPAIGSGVVALAMITGGILFINERRGGGL